MSVKSDLATGYANLNARRGRKDYLGTARALKRLKRLPEYSTNQKLADTFQVSREIIREFLVLLDLPPAVQRLMESGNLKLEHGVRLRQLMRKRPDLVVDAAQAMKGLRTHQARHLVDYLLKHPELDALDAREAVLKSKSQVAKEYHVVAILSEDQYREVSARARKSGLPVSEFVSSVLVSWLNDGVLRQDNP